MTLASSPTEPTGAGLDLTSHAGGVIMEDFDGDGLLDIVVSSSGPLDQMHLFRNNGVKDGQVSFTDVTSAGRPDGRNRRAQPCAH